MVAQFGDPSTSEQRLNFSQSFNPPGTIVGVLIGTFFIFSGVNKTPAEVLAMKAQNTYVNYLHSEILRVVPTYVFLGFAVLVIAFFCQPRTLSAAPGFNRIRRLPVAGDSGKAWCLRTPSFVGRS